MGLYRSFRRLRALLALSAALALLLVACGADEADDVEDIVEDVTDEVEDVAEDVTDDAPDDEEEPADDDGEAPAETVDVTFMLPSDNPLQYYPLFLAEELGYYAEEGLNVTIEDIDGSGQVMQQVIAANTDIGMPSPPAYLNGVSRDQDVYFFYQMHYTNVFDLIAPADSGISSVEDLRGEAIGITEEAGGEVPFVRAIMGDAGMTEGEDYTLLPIGEGGALTFNALESGDVAAYAGSIYDIANLDSAGMDTSSVMPEEYRNYPANGFVVTGDTLESESDMLTRFLRAVNKATVFGRANPEAALEIATRDRPDLYDDPEIVDAYWEATLGMMTPPQAVADDAIGTMYFDGWQGFHDFMVAAPEDQGGLPQEVDLETYLHYDLLDGAMDFDAEAVEAEAESWTG
jgi:NitT/TauT family transport system substrate-binding protein